MIKTTTVLSVILSVMLSFAVIGGVYANWHYAEEPAESATTGLGVAINEFIWKAEEILPTVKPGQNYLDLHEAIINNAKAGLNGSKDSLEEAVIKEKNSFIHSGYNLHGSNMKHLFITEACKELDFVLAYYSDTEFHLFIFKISDTKEGVVGVDKISVYKSILKKANGVWESEEVQMGFATTKRLNSNTIIIDHKSWYR